MRTDFFTRKHKSIRARLFETSDAIGRADWTDDDAVKGILQRLDAIDADLKAHGEHEDKYLMPLLQAGAPDLLAAIDEDHDADVARRASLVRHAHAAAAAPPERRTMEGLAFYRAFNRYVASYLEHLDAEETRVMPMLWASVAEERLAAALGKFIQEVASKQPPQDAAHMMAHITPADRAEMLRGLRIRLPRPAFESMLDLVIVQLTDDERERLARDLAS